jgi:hypothetical protein
VLISSAIAGDGDSLQELRGLLLPGVRWLLARRNANPSLADEILTDVLRSVSGGQISCPSDLLRETRLSINRAAARRESQPLGSATSSAAAVHRGISGREREMMRRYYVDREPPETICARMSVHPAVFAEVKKRFRASIETRVTE